MIIPDAATLAPNEKLEADICIIGSGAAGIPIARELIEHDKPYKRTVIVLESSLKNTLEKPTLPQGVDVEALKGLEFPPYQPHRYEDGTVQPCYWGTWQGQSTTLQDDFFLRSRIRYYGGTTNCWGGWTRPLAEIDFNRSDVNAFLPWPIAARDLNEFYRRAMDYCSLSLYDVSSYDNPAFWFDKTSTAIAPLALPENSQLQNSVFTKIFGDAFDRDNDGRLDFQKIWGDSIEKAGNVTLYRNANVVFFEGDTSVTQVKAFAVVDGKPKKDPFYVKATRYVLAASCIENTRLLLWSKTRQSDGSWKGIGPSAGPALGRHLITHPLLEKAATFTVDKWPGQAVQDFFVNEPQTNEPKGHAPNIFCTLVPTAGWLRRKARGNFRARLNFGSGSGATGGVNLNWEQFPNSLNYVQEGPTVDMFGVIRPHINLGLGQLDRDTRDDALNLIRDALYAKGYAKKDTYQKFPDKDLLLPGAHAMGTTRMSESIQDGVVNSNCRLHGVDNLYVAGGSVFCSAGYANPTLTIVALALRLADHLKTPV